MKHVGRFKKNRRKVVVAYRVIPGDADHCLVVQTESLNSEYHDSMIRMLESNAGQTAYEFAEAMSRATLPDGRNMLAAFHREGKLTKMPTEDVEMTPNMQSSIALNELNSIIAEQKGVTVADLAIGADRVKKTPENSGPKMEAVDAATQYTDAKLPNTEAVAEMNTVDDVIVTEEKPLTDEDLAKQYRSQADALFKEAQALRKAAKELTSKESEKQTD
jgi:hypothetical protein